jgi:hypothetical protein
VTEFIAGDKVIGIAKHHGGETLTVLSGKGHYSRYIPCKDAAGYQALMLPEEIELVKPAAKFKVGDWVKVQGRGDKWDGTVGIVQKASSWTYSNRHFLYTIHKDGKAADDLRFFEDQLVATEAPKPVFKKGDIVAPKELIYMSHKDKTLIVEEVKSEGTFCVKVRALGDPKADALTYSQGELIPGEPLAEWEIELLDFCSPYIEKAKAAHPSNGKAATDLVNDPSHYGGKDNPYEVIKVAEAWGFEKNAYLFNALKYLGRAGKKGSKVEDLKKLVYYTEREIALEEAK